MMDWTGKSRKAKHDQHLNEIIFGRAVPNAALSSSDRCRYDRKSNPDRIGRSAALAEKWASAR